MPNKKRFRKLKPGRADIELIIKPKSYYLVDLRDIFKPQVLRIKFKTPKKAKEWLNSRNNRINKMQFQVELGSTILEYNIPMSTLYRNASYRNRQRISLLFRESGNYQGGNKPCD